MRFIYNRKVVDIPKGTFKRSKKGDKAKFERLLRAIGYKDVEQAWKSYCK